MKTAELSLEIRPAISLHPKPFARLAAAIFNVTSARVIAGSQPWAASAPAPRRQPPRGFVDDRAADRERGAGTWAQPP
jgi:hypothetical protein